MLLKIVTEPNEILHKKTKAVEPADLASKNVRKMIKNMVETMRVKDGVGLAAPQVGSNLAICVIHGHYADKEKKDRDLILINPTWGKINNKKEKDYEACLSIPGVAGSVERFKSIEVKAIDPEGKPLNFIAEDYFARIIQHEVDHLNGILFTEKAKGIQAM